MKHMIFMLLIFLVTGCGSVSQTERLAGPWTSYTTSGEMSMLVLQKDSTYTLDSKVGSPWAATFRGKWTPHGRAITIYDAPGRPWTVGYLTGRGQFFMNFRNEIYYFERIGTGTWQGGN